MNTPKNKDAANSKSQPAIPPLKMEITTDYNLWSLLLQGSNSEGSKKLSKAEAYFDLMKRQRLTMLTKDESYLGGGILALAKDWRWDRTTVKKFIDALCSIEAATFEKVGNRAVIKLTNVTLLHPDGSDA